MKYLIILAVLVTLCTLLYVRLRPYIQVARRIFGVVRRTRSVAAGVESPAAVPARQANQSGERLVRCAACGTWLPASRALKLRSAASSSYCSHACVERSADGVSDQPTRRSAQ